MGLVSMKVLRTLYQSLGGDSATRYHVYYYLVSLANKSTVYTDMASTRNMFKQFQPLLSPATCVLPTRIQARRGGVDT